MPEPVRCLQQAHRALKPGGRIAVATWGPPQDNVWVSLPMGILRKYYSGPGSAATRRRRAGCSRSRTRTA